MILFSFIGIGLDDTVELSIGRMEYNNKSFGASTVQRKLSSLASSTFRVEIQGAPGSKKRYAWTVKQERIALETKEAMRYRRKRTDKKSRGKRCKRSLKDFTSDFSFLSLVLLHYPLQNPSSYSYFYFRRGIRSFIRDCIVS